jgi:hypothetical protein
MNSDLEMPQSAKCGSSVPRLPRHKAVLSPVAITFQSAARGSRRVRCTEWLGLIFISLAYPLCAFLVREFVELDRYHGVSTAATIEGRHADPAFTVS